MASAVRLVALTLLLGLCMQATSAQAASKRSGDRLLTALEVVALEGAVQVRRMRRECFVRA